MNKKRTLYILFHGRFPSEKAASLFAAKEAESFALQGENVVLLVSNRKGKIEAPSHEYYGVQNIYTVRALPVLDLFGAAFDRIAFVVSYISFAVTAFFYFLRNIKKGDVVMSNDLGILFACSFIARNTLYEMHDFPESKKGLFSFFLKHIRYVLVHNKWKYEKLFTFCKLNPKQVLCLPNAVEIKDFDIPISKEEARLKVGLTHLPGNVCVAVYTGHLYGWKGVATLASAAKFLPAHFRIVFIGGTEADVAAFRATYGGDERVVILGHRHHKEIPLFQKAADMLILPNTAKENISKYYTSPMKLFEYMASKKPIIASAIPSIEEIINREMATFFEADNARDLANKIIEVNMLYNEKCRMTERAFEEVQQYTWNARAKTILTFISGNYNA